MPSSFALSASRKSIRFGGTDREAGQCRQYQFAPEVSRRSGGANLPSSWQGQQYPETRPWSPALWAEYAATTAQGPNASSRRLRTGLPTHRSPWRSFQRATGLPWNLTFADAAEKVRAGESGHSQAAITDVAMVPAERLHPKAAYSRCRPIAVGGGFSASGRSTSELDVRSRRRESQRRRQRSFERGQHRPGEESRRNDSIRRPCTHTADPNQTSAVLISSPRC